MTKRFFRIGVSFLLACCICLICLPFFQQLTGVATSAKPFSASINGLEKVDGENLAETIEKTNLQNAPLTSIDVITGNLFQSDFELLKKDNKNIVLSRLIINEKPPKIAGISAFYGCPSDRTVFVSEKFLNDYKNADDGNLTDNKWFGWNIDSKSADANSTVSAKKIVISAISTKTIPGGTCEFFANMQENNINLPNKTFNWLIEGNLSLNTTINSAGSLKIGDDETAKTITVKAMCENITGTLVITIGGENENFDSLLNSLLTPEDGDERCNVVLSQEEDGANLNDATVGTKSPLNLFASATVLKPPQKNVMIENISQSIKAKLVRIDYTWSKDGIALKNDETNIINNYEKNDEHKSSLVINNPQAGTYKVEATAFFNYPDDETNFIEIKNSTSCAISISDTKLIKISADIDFSRSEYEKDIHPDAFINPIIKTVDENIDIITKPINGEISYIIDNNKYSIENPKDSDNLKPYQIKNGKVVEPLTFLGANTSTQLSYGKHKITIQFTPKNEDESTSIYMQAKKTTTFKFHNLNDAKLINTNDILTATIKSPVTNEKPNTFCDANESYTAKIIWTLGDSIVEEAFLPEKNYKANIILTAKEGYLFSTGNERLNNLENEFSKPAKITILTENLTQIDEEKYLSIVTKPNKDETKPDIISGANSIFVSIKFAKTANPNLNAQSPIKFINKLPLEKKYGDVEFAVALRGGNGDGKFIIQSSNKKVLSIDDKGDGTAIAKITGAGTAKIIAIKESGKEEINGKIESFNSIQIESDEIKVTPQTLVAFAPNVTAKVGSTISSIPINVTGFVNGDNEKNLLGYVAPTTKSAGFSDEISSNGNDISKPEISVANIGKYDIIVSNGQPTSKYEFKYFNSILTVNQTGIAQPEDTQTIQTPISSILNVKHNVAIERADTNVFDAGTSLEVINKTNTISSDEKKSYNNNISKKFDGREILSLYEITLKKDNATINPDGTLKVTVKIPPEILKSNQNFAIAYINEKENTVSQMESTISGDDITFSTNHFSKYAIIGQTANISQAPKSTLNIAILFLIFAAFLTTTILLFQNLILKKKVKL